MYPVYQLIDPAIATPVSLIAIVVFIFIAWVRG
jgi:hypothetical protein